MHLSEKPAGPTRVLLPRLSPFKAVGLALLIVMAGVAIRLGFSEALHRRATFIFFVPAVVAAAALSGLRDDIDALVAKAAAAGVSADTLSALVKEAAHGR